MSIITQPLREEHRELLKNLEMLRVTADSITEINLTPSTLSGIDKIFEFLVHSVIPHALAEDKALYPVIQKITRSPHFTETMSHDHMVMSNLTRELSFLRTHISGFSVTKDLVLSLRRVLYGLYLLVKVHIDGEEEVYLPLLEENLKPEEFKSMMEAIDRAVLEVKDDIPLMLEGFKSS
jgi:hemerythrin-like domain-containing protein